MKELKFLIVILIQLLVASCAFGGRAPASTGEASHLVLDIDWTIVTEIKDPLLKVTPASRVIEVAGVRYFVNEGLEELIEQALSYPDVKISFFSGGTRLRNNELLSKIKLKNGKSLKDISTFSFGKEDLVKNDEALPDAKFAERLKKDLTLISKKIKSIIMLDDTPNFVLNKFEQQSDSVLFIGKAFEYFNSFEEASGKSGEYVPKDFDEWLLNRKKLYILKEAFKESYEESKLGEYTLLEAMKRREKLLDLPSLRWNAYSKELYEKAMKGRGQSKDLNCPELFLRLITEAS